MNRREALTSLAALAGAVGITVTPVTTREAEAATLTILRTDRLLSREQSARLKALWEDACIGTDLEHVKTIVVSGDVTVEIVRGRG